MAAAPQTPSPISKVAVGDKLEYNSTTKGGWVECKVVETRADGAFQVEVKPRHWFTAEELAEKFRRPEPFIIMVLPEMTPTQADLLDVPKGVRCELEPHETDLGCRGLLINWLVPSGNQQISHHTVELKR